MLHSNVYFVPDIECFRFRNQTIKDHYLMRVALNLNLSYGMYYIAYMEAYRATGTGKLEGKVRERMNL